MKQLLLRIPDALYSRLVARALIVGGSINSIANQILDRNIDDELSLRRARIRARAQRLGMLRVEAAPRVESDLREHAIHSTCGLGQQIDRLLADGR